MVVENSLGPYHLLRLGIREDGRPRLDSLSAYPRLTQPITSGCVGFLGQPYPLVASFMGATVSPTNQLCCIPTE